MLDWRGRIDFLFLSLFKHLYYMHNSMPVYIMIARTVRPKRIYLNFQIFFVFWQKVKQGIQKHKILNFQQKLIKIKKNIFAKKNSKFW